MAKEKTSGLTTSTVKDEIDSWIPKVQETSNKVKKVYGYFNNHYHGYAPENCLQLIEKLGLATEEQKKAKCKENCQTITIGSIL